MDGGTLSDGQSQNIQILQTVENLLTRFQGEYFLLALSPQYRQNNCQISSFQGKEFLSKNLHIIQDFLQHCYDVSELFYNQFTSEGGDGRIPESGGAGDMEVTVINKAISRLEKAIAESDNQVVRGTGDHSDTTEWKQDDKEVSEAEGQNLKQECLESECENEDPDDKVSGEDNCPGSSPDTNIKPVSNEFRNFKLKKGGKFKLDCNEKFKFRDAKIECKDSMQQGKRPKKKIWKNAEQKLKCDLCGKELRDEKSLKKHLSSHKCEEHNCVLECKMCGMKFRASEEYDRHMTSQCSPDKLECTRCNRTFRNQKTLSAHLRICSSKVETKEEGKELKNEALKTREVVEEDQTTSHGTGGAILHKISTNKICLECPSCYVMIENEEEFLSHLESHGTVLSDTCLHCKRECHEGSELARHIILSHMKQRKIIRKRKNANLKMITPSSVSQNDKWMLNLDGPDAQFKCPNCQTIFRNIKCFVYHLNSYANNGRNYCGICHRFFTYKSNLTKHMKYTHSSLKNFICDVCGKSFKHNDSLKIHKKGHEEGRSSSLECTECGKLLSCTTALKVHMRRHTGSTPYMCEICGKAFKQSSNLQKHMLVHTTETLFKCEICSKEFKYQETYKNHMTAHILKSGKAEGNKTQFSRIYTCEYCGKQFSTGSQHKVHLRTHTNERPYKCKQCDKAFKEHGKLSRHMKIHGMDAKNRSRHKGSLTSGEVVLEKNTISYHDETMLTPRAEDSVQCVLMDNPSAGSVATPQTISIPNPQAVSVPQDHAQIVPLPPQTDVSVNVIQGIEGQATDTSSDTGTVLLQMMPSSQYQHYVSPPPQIQVPHPQGQPDSAHTGGYEVQQYFRSFTFQNTSMEGHPL